MNGTTFSYNLKILDFNFGSVVPLYSMLTRGVRNFKYVIYNYSLAAEDGVSILGGTAITEYPLN